MQISGGKGPYTLHGDYQEPRLGWGSTKKYLRNIISGWSRLSKNKNKTNTVLGSEV